MRGIGAWVLAAIAGSAWADPMSDAVAKLRSGDSGVRDEGTRELAALSAADPEALWPLLADADPEVAARIGEILEPRGALDKRRYGERKRLLGELSSMKPGDPGRSDAVRRLLAFDRWGREDLARELEEGQLVAGSDPVRVATFGSPHVVRLHLRNEGRLGAWLAPGTFRFGARRAMPGRGDVVPFGSRRHWGGRLNLGPRPAPHDRKAETGVRLLSEMVRVAPGSEVEIFAGEIPGNRMGLWSVVAHVGLRSDGGPEPIQFAETKVPMRPALPKAQPTSGVAFVAARTGSSFDLRVVRFEDPPGFGLEVTCLTAPRKTESSEDFDNYWWLAEGEERVMLGSGGFSWVDRVPEWKQDETRAARMDAAVPAGTRVLWLGFDTGFGDAGESFVADPIAIPTR